MNYLENRVHFIESIECARKELLLGNFNQAISLLSEAATFAWENYCGVFLDKAFEHLIEEIAAYANAESLVEVEGAEEGKVGFLMTSIHSHGGHSKIAWRWMQLDEENYFTLLLTGQEKSPTPEQLDELVSSGKVTCIKQVSDDLLERIRQGRDALAHCSYIVMNIHPDDVVGAAIAACLKHRSKIIFIDHAFFSFSIGMTSARAICSTSPAAVAIALDERLVNPQHLLWYRNAPEWIDDEAPSDSGLRNRLGLPLDSTFILSSGSEYKFYAIDGLDLFELVAPVLEQTPNAFLVVVGISTGQHFFLGQRLRHLRNRIIFVPPVSERSLLQYLAECDIYVESVPFHSGGASQQAMLLGKPVINYVAPDFYRANLSPQLFPVDDFSWFHFSVDSYREDLSDLIGSESLRVQRGKYLYERVSASISAGNNLASIMEAYRKASQNPLVACTMLEDSFRVERPLAHKARELLVYNFATYRATGKPPVSADPTLQVPSSSGNVDPFAKVDEAKSLLRLIAFYLPQFHAVPENDVWWGKGFTEWTNVRQGKPLFDGHYQPHEPAELGYYDLTEPEVLVRQAELAREHGIHGFCFYYYWFDGKRLLERPVDMLLRHPEIDLPFCLCWANENWTRRWDGGEQEVLMHQSYSPELHERFAIDLIPYLSDARYIRIDGKPGVLVYRGDIIPDLPQTLAAWRDTWRAAGIGEVYLIGVESFKIRSPEAVGFDANCEFLPHQVSFNRIRPDEGLCDLVDERANIGDYGKLADSWLARPRPSYKRFRGIVPSWDNASRRRKGGATVLVNSSPQRYEQWLAATLRKTAEEFDGDERVVFVNAWNEWAEGCHLEPDVRHGRAYLEATRRAMVDALPALQEPASSALPTSAATAAGDFNAVYRAWLARRHLSPVQLEQLADRIEGWGQRPKILPVVVDLGGRGDHLQRTLRSLEKQSYPSDGVLILSNTSMLPEYASHWHSREEDWPSQLNRLLADSASDWFQILFAGDELDANALLLLAERIATGPAFACYYSDEDLLHKGEAQNPLFKPDFNLDLMRSYPYVGRSLAFDRARALELGGLPDGFVDLALHDLVFRLVEAHGLGAIGHIPEVLYHSAISFGQWLAEPGVANSSAALVSRHLERLQLPHTIQPGSLPVFNRVIYKHTEQPLVSIIVPTKDLLPLLQRCIETLVEKTSYPHYELLVVDNASETPEAQAWLGGLANLGAEHIRVLSYPQPFNYSAMNNLAVSQARGEYLILLNNDTAIVQDDWIETLLNHAQRAEVGIVGAKLHYPDGSIQHGGVVLGLRGPADHPFIGEPMDTAGYMHRLKVDQNYSVVTAACMMVRKEVYEAVGGMDEGELRVSYNDVDLCLKVQAAGYLAVWTPYTVLLHEGSASQKRIDTASQDAKRERFRHEQDVMYRRWLPLIANDPAYNRNLSLHERGFELETGITLPWQPFQQRRLPRLLCHPADASGSGHYRVQQPFRAMEQAGLVEGALYGSLLPVVDLQRFDPDVVVFQRQINERQLAFMRNTKQGASVFKVYELDDYLPNLPTKSIHRQHMPKDISKALRTAISMTDRLVVSTEPLAQALGKLHDDIRIMPNLLPPAWWQGLASQRRHGRKPRVGWAGGAGHAGDLQIIQDLVRDLADEVDWVFLGLLPEGCGRYVREFHPGVSIEEYPRKLASLDLDLALAPLENNQFNECKSNLRLLEYGACGFPVICTDIAPYKKGLPVTRVRNRYKDWRDAIRMHLSDLETTHRAGDELRRVVSSEWMLDGENLQRWLKAWLPS